MAHGFMVISAAQSIDNTAATAHQLYRHLLKEKNAIDG